MAFKWLIVDYGGVLALDHLDGPETELAALFHCSRENLRRAITEKSELGKAIRLDYISEQDFWYEVSLQLCGRQISVSPQELTKRWASCYTINHCTVELIRFAQLQGLKVGIATNVDRYRERHMQIAVSIFKVSPKIFASWRMGYMKPDRLYFDRIASDVLSEKVYPNEVLFLDDRSEHAHAASTQGFFGITYVDNLIFRDKIQSYIVN